MYKSSKTIIHRLTMDIEQYVAIPTILVHLDSFCKEPRVVQ